MYYYKHRTWSELLNHFQEKICEDSSSFDLTSTDLATAIEELAKLSEKIYELTKHEDQSLVEMTDSSTMPGKGCSFNKSADVKQFNFI